MPADAALADYYARRASEYERIYEKPERQSDLALLRERLAQLFTGRNVLEVACGTGYWTQVIARTAKSVTATDLNEETLAIARTKEFQAANVRILRADAFRCSTIDGRFDAGLAAFWWSHLRRDEWQPFFEEFHRAILPGSLVVLLDNRFVPGSSTPIARTDGHGNTYQQRRLANGETHEVLKNFPTEAGLRAALARVANNLLWDELDYYWLATYRTLEPGAR